LSKKKEKPTDKQIKDATQRFLENEALTIYTVNRYFSNQPKHLYNDLIGAARLGLWKACLSFNSTLGTRFSTYAVRCIKNEINLFLRQEARQVPTVSINESVPELEETSYESLLGGNGDVHAEVITEEIIQALKKFPILHVYITGTKTQKELAEQLGRSQTAISRLIKRDRYRLKQLLKKSGLLD